MIELIHADCLVHMVSMDANSVDSIVSDPPYGLSFMGKDWDHGVPGVHFWEAALRVAKPGAYLLAFGGTRTFHRLAVAIEDAGWEIRDTLMWVYGSGFPKSHNGPWGGTALKPAWEPIIMARKPLEGTVAQNVLKHRTGGINVNGCRVDGDAHRIWNYTGGGDCTAFNDSRSGDPSITKEQVGRWPANVIHDGSEEVVKHFPEASGQQYRTTGEEGRGPTNTYGKYDGVVAMEPRDNGGSAARFFYCAKASKEDRDEGLNGFELVKGGAMSGIETRPDRPTNHPHRANHHPTVKPTDLMRYLCRLVTPPSGMVFDPFMGSGSTGKAAILEGFSFTGCDLQAEYVAIAKARCTWAEEEHFREHAQQSLFPVDDAPRLFAPEPVEPPRQTTIEDAH